MKRIQIIATISLITVILLSTYFVYFKQNESFSFQHSDALKDSNDIPETKKNQDQPQDVIMGVMGNQTEKAELGRATWKFLHTMMARYPEEPTENERKSLHDFMMLFSTLYPCGECARHFNKMIAEFPPQTSSRFSASQWLCGMHNKVNERLKKPIFDCSSIEEHYPCGCAVE